MKYLYFLSLCLISISLGATAQVHKRFLNKDNETIKDSTKASSYILYKKEDQDSSYIWSAVKLNKRKMPIMKGYYLDEELTIPHGKFIYYQPLIRQTSIDAHHSSIDTTFVKKQVGFYNNGLKEGAWMEYFPDGVLGVMENYENDQLQGLYEEYDDRGSISSRGYYVKGSKEGEWNIFWPDSTIKTQITWSGGHVDTYRDFDAKDHMVGAYPGYNFKYHIYRYLKKAKLPVAHGFVFIEFTVATDGQLIKPEIKMGVLPILDQGVLDAVTNSPKWQSATLKKKRIEQRVTLAFEYDSGRDN
jgi:antitoxin component YwqK of YwqJK toxin-antitoxin module